MKYFLWILGLVATVACAKKENPAEPTPTPPRPFTLKKEVVVTGLTTPWGMTFINDNEVLIAEKSGDILLANVSTGSKESIFKVPGSVSFGQGGLMDIKIHPQFSQNNWVYFCYTKRNGAQATTALGRAQFTNNQLNNFEEIFVANAFTTSGVHFGSRLAFDGKGHLFMSIGDRGSMQQAQNTTNHIGCVIRLNDDGTVPTNNPFVGQSGFAAELWTYGNRNIQGLDFNPTTGELWGHEHGPQGGDEINILRPGLNFGWPLATFGQQYGGGVIGDTAGAGLTQPILYWTPSIAPCGMTFLRSDVYPGWKGSLFIGALAGQHLNRTVFQNDQPISEDRYFVGEGRIRNVGQSPDGYIYLANETEGSLIKLVPEFTE